MYVELYEHNKAAYLAAVAMLGKTKKAAIVHPTGTGKSFIGFKLCEDNPDKRICWISPSEYIYKTQRENLKRTTGGYIPQNILFFTYAKLMNMTSEELCEILPDYIILDEFHRCGAQMWGQGVKNLLSCFPETPVLGMSATAIRYLDNQRDMSDELFDGNVASEMTLGEAVVRGILMPPKYVTTVFSFSENIERYGNRIKKLRNKNLRDNAMETIEALKRTLENADGIDKVIQKHITEKTGKYIVFCSNKEHMDEMISHVDEWFGKIDSDAHIYAVYSDLSESEAEFDRFKEDNSKHLKLLFCIDMLNEGVHVEDISGVILFRPTVSPIVFKQQIGRAMAAGCDKNAVILDIVDNISNLYNISSVHEEMQNAIDFYRYYGENEKIVNDRFTVIDEVYDCRRLFDELENMLSASWDIMYLEAEKYYKAFGDLLPDSHYITELGYPLGQWVVSQRQMYRNASSGSLSEERIKKLEEIGMDWLTRNERLWKKAYAEAQKFYVQNGHLNVEKKNGSLYSWILRQRKRYKDGEMSSEEYKQLSDIGMVWELESSWDIHYPEAVRFYKENGNLDIPASFVTETGVKLGTWYRTMRNKYREGMLNDEEKKALEDIGMEWESVKNRTWMMYYGLAKEYYDQNGDLAVNLKYSKDGQNLGIWISSQRYAKKKGSLSDEQISLLEEIGMSWHQFSNKWEMGYGYALQYFEENNSCNAPAEYVHPDGFKLGAWIATQRNKYKNGKLRKKQISRLEEIGIDWNPSGNAWMNTYNEAKLYFEKYGDLFVPANYVTESGTNLSAWIVNQRTKYRKSLLSKEQIELLERCNMCWQITEKKWLEGYGHAMKYFNIHGHINIPQDYKTETGYNLGTWLSSNRKSYHSGKLSEERISKLEKLGVLWDKKGDDWKKAYSIAREYQNKFHNLNELSTTYVFAEYNLGQWLRSQRRSYRKGALSSERKELLSAIGVVFD